ncbi:MAG: RagB/SusD family nutrient uptake outer membrane protein [Bacteroidales bacterium]|nr:RagB/SusD family nutrient uptake outer membrane protein [Bacteroidales bacterium]
MKNITKILAVIGLLALTSCDFFLQKPDTTGNVDRDAVFSSKKNAEAALMSCYSNALVHGLPGGLGYTHGTLGAISGEINRGASWHGTYFIAQQGLNVNGAGSDATDSANGSSAGSENWAKNWSVIRQCFIVKENIDKVADMSQDDKDVIKAEVTALIAYRYMGMFYRYGGVPVVTRSFEASDDLTAGRVSLEETLQYILDLCDEAHAGLPAKWDAANTGRMTQGVVLAIKARALMYAARPLFNRATPYLDFGENNNLICFGNADKERWNDAIEANEAVLTWAAANGVSLINTGDAFKDYATATSTPGNKEVILAFKNNSTSQDYSTYVFLYNNCSAYWTWNRFDNGESGVLSNHIKYYYKKDGSEMKWPVYGNQTPRSGAEWIENVADLEPRALADIKFAGHDAMNNTGDTKWTSLGWGRNGYDGKIGMGDAFPNSVGGSDKGQLSGERTKFYYKAGSRTWFEFPLFRLAETYLNLAEAYNEYGNSGKALENLNKVHQRAGLPAVTETNQSKLREIIQREKFIEFFGENHKYFDVKHWMREDIGDGICGGSMRAFTFNIKAGATWPYDKSTIDTWWETEYYQAFWSPAMYLEPFPQSEVNKGTITQNPGY